MRLDAIGISKKEAKTLTERITSQMISCGKYTVLDRGNTDKILDEMKLHKWFIISKHAEEKNTRTNLKKLGLTYIHSLYVYV